MKRLDDFDELLYSALAPAETPDVKLNKNIQKHLSEKNSRHYKRIKRPILVAAILVIVLMLSATGFAARVLLSPRQVAEELFEDKLASAFESKDAIQINETIVSNDFSITLLGIVSGHSLQSDNSYFKKTNANKTYAVISIEKSDGSRIPDLLNNPEIGTYEFYVSTLFNGQKPWQTYFNHVGDITINRYGVLYKLIECDDIEIFADRGVYLGVSKGHVIELDTFSYNEKTDKISINPSNHETTALFHLPLDPAKADHVKAEIIILKQRLIDLTKPYEPNDPEDSVDFATAIKTSEIIPSSIKTVSYDSYDLLYYEYEGGYVSGRVEDFFQEGQTGLSNYLVKIVEDDSTVRRAARFSRESDGTITGMVYTLDWSWLFD